MSQRQEVLNFFQKVCDDPQVQNALKPPCPPTREGFAQVAQANGYTINGHAIDDYVRFYQFYHECQGAIDRHQQGKEKLADWLNQWEQHLQNFDDDPMDDRHDTIKRFM
ncbi:MAG: hypothetical protein F6J87_22280 [Spirulina sp. SIO3F2]|nr:hypothetical protein [Spirulina sp. SIO3F2]